MILGGIGNARKGPMQEGEIPGNPKSKVNKSAAATDNDIMALAPDDLQPRAVNVRHMRAMGLLSSTPDHGGVWLARHGNSDSGHAGIVADVHGSRIVAIEGNTSAGPTADPAQQRQGDGIWIRTFPLGGRGDLVTQGFVSVESILKIAA